MRVQRKKILVYNGCRERERETVVGIERLRPERAGRDHRVRDVVAVFPGDWGADLHRELLGLKGEVVDVDLALLGAGASGREHEGRGDGQPKGRSKAAATE